jgi:beta-lactam-binding protein with PASTA domain
MTRRRLLLLGIVAALLGALTLGSCSKPAAQIPVPNVVGRQYPAAESMLQSAGLKYRIETTEHNLGLHPHPIHSVISQQPRAGARVEPGTIVTFVVEGHINH